MKWKNPHKEKPEDGQIVWVLLEHSKKNGAQSCEIYAGEYRNGAVHNHDDIGTGWQIWEFPEDNKSDCNKVAAWCYESDIPLPKN